MNSDSRPVVLYIDNDADIRAAWAAYLSLGGYEVIPCSGIKQAEDAVKTRKVDAIISEIMLPGAQPEMLEKFLKKCEKDGVGIIIITYLDVGIPEGFRDTRVIEKGTEPYRIVKALAAIVEQKKGDRKSGLFVTGATIRPPNSDRQAKPLHRKRRQKY